MAENIYLRKLFNTSKVFVIQKGSGKHDAINKILCK